VAQAEVRHRLDEIWATTASKDIARLESFHSTARSSDFKDGALARRCKENQEGEREFFKVLSEPKVDMKDLVGQRLRRRSRSRPSTADFSGKVGGQAIAAKSKSTMISWRSTATGRSSTSTSRSSARHRRR